METKRILFLYIGFALVQFLDDGIFHVLSSTDVVVKDDEKVAKYEDNNFYKCTVLKLSGTYNCNKLFT